MKLHKLAFLLLALGGIVWLIVGIWPTFDLAAYIGTTLARIVYILVGLSALIEIFGHKRNCKACMMKNGQNM